MINLPTTPGPVSIDWQQIDFGGTLSPPLGGADQRLNRLENRWQITVQLPPMMPIVAGVWLGTLNRGLREGVRWNIRQVEMGLAPLIYCAVFGAGQSGATLAVELPGVGYTFRSNQAITITNVATGRRYVHFVTQDTVISTASGTIPIAPPLRHEPGNTDPIMVTQPTIEGLLVGDGVGWTIDRARRVGLSFTIREQR